MSKKIDPLDALNVAGNLVGGDIGKVAKAAGKVKDIVNIAKSLGGLFGKKPKRD